MYVKSICLLVLMKTKSYFKDDICLESPVFNDVTIPVQKYVTVSAIFFQNLKINTFIQ